MRLDLEGPKENFDHMLVEAIELWRNGGICILTLKSTFPLNLIKGLKSLFWRMCEVASDICIHFCLVLYIFGFSNFISYLEFTKFDELRIFGFQMVNG